jgi:hypothetical protein
VPRFTEIGCIDASDVRVLTSLRIFNDIGDNMMRSTRRPTISRLLFIFVFYLLYPNLCAINFCVDTPAPKAVTYLKLTTVKLLYGT